MKRGEKATDFEEIYNRYFKDVYRYMLSLSKNESIAEEITQETFYKALNSIDTFNGSCKIYVWLCQIAKNTYLSWIKKEKRFDPDACPDEKTSGGGFEQRLFDQESLFEIHKCLHALEEPYKEVFSLRMFGELSFAQIASLFGKTESWARVTYHRARLKIKEDLL